MAPLATAKMQAPAIAKRSMSNGKAPGSPMRRAKPKSAAHWEARQAEVLKAMYEREPKRAQKNANLIRSGAGTAAPFARRSCVCQADCL